MTLDEIIEQSLKDYLNAQHYAHCSELLFRNVTKAWAPDFDEKLMRIATPFGGGLAGTQDVCGALVGGTMAIGYLLGRRTFNEDGKLCWPAAEEYYRRFRQEFGETTCRHIRGQIVNWNSHVKCSSTVRTSLKLLWEVLEKAEREGKLKRL